MFRKSKITYIAGSAIIGITTLLIAFLTLLATGGLGFGNADLLTFATASYEKTYDGTPLVGLDWKLVSGKLADGDTAEATVVGSRTDAGVGANEFSITIRDESGNDVSGRYNIDIRPGTLTVNPRYLKLTADSATKVYDGTPLVCKRFDVTAGELVEAHTVETRFAEWTDAGSVANDFSAQILDENGADVSRNYNIVCDPGVLTVEKRQLSLSTHDGIKEYDGLPFSIEGYEIVGGEIASGQRISAKTPMSQTDVGAVKNWITELRIEDKFGNDVITNYTITYFEGSLKVIPRNLAVRSADASKKYDGKPLTAPEWKFSSDVRPVTGHTITVAVSGTRTEIGEGDNTLSQIVLKTENGMVVTQNYSFLREPGQLVVTGDSSGDVPSTPPSDTEIGGPDGLDMTPAMRLFSDVSGSVYLREMSYGNYTGKGWKAVPNYAGLLDSKFSMNYLTGLALKNVGYKSQRISIDAMTTGYLLPYYLDTASANYRIQDSDVWYSGKTDAIYSVYHYAYDEKIPIMPVTGEYAAAERAYRAYVYANYMGIPSSTRTFLNQIISNEQFDKSNPNVVAAVASYIQNSAVYNLNYDRALDGEADIAVAFLSKYKEGICQHYATAGTLLFRALGIPARYTTGMAGSTVAGRWNVIPKKNAHAWVEIYLDGIGWVQVEVTGSGFAGDPNGETDAIVLKPFDRFLRYDGTSVLRADNALQGLSGFLAKGYTYTAVVTGERSQIGIGFSVIEKFALFDPSGKDVTDSISWEFHPGLLQMYVLELNLYTDSGRFKYDGTEHFLGSGGYRLEGALMSGHKLKSALMTGRQTVAGQSANTCEIVIVDAEGRDVTSWYKINTHFGTLTVTARNITVQAGSAVKVYDGEMLSCEDYVLTSSDHPGQVLANGDKIVVKMFGVQINIGTSQNLIYSVVILDADGNDVTASYGIETLSGTLTVTRS